MLCVVWGGGGSNRVDQYDMTDQGNNTHAHLLFLLHKKQQVGRVDVETKYWGRPEDENMPRPAFMVTSNDGAADVAGTIAGALAAGALVFKDSDPSYTDELIKSAEMYWKFGNKTRKAYTDTDLDSQYLYNSTSFYDDLAWGAAWLYRATNNQRYLGEMYNNYVRHVRLEGEVDFHYIFDPTNLFWPTNLVMAQVCFCVGGTHGCACIR